MNYTCERSSLILRATKLLLPRLSQEGFDQLFYQVEMPLADFLQQPTITHLAQLLQTAPASPTALSPVVPHIAPLTHQYHLPLTLLQWYQKTD